MTSPNAEEAIPNAIRVQAKLSVVTRHARTPISAAATRFNAGYKKSSKKALWQPLTFSTLEAAKTTTPIAINSMAIRIAVGGHRTALRGNLFGWSRADVASAAN